MAVGRKEALPAARAWLGSMLVAWTIVTGCAAVIATAWYQRTKDLTVLIAYLGAPFLLGVALFLAIGVVGIAARTKVTAVELPPKNPLGDRRGMMFGRK